MNFDVAVNLILDHEGGYVNDPNILKSSIDSALNRESDLAADFFLEPKKHRNIKCSITSCNRFSYARNLCNAHYIRDIKGLSMDEPIRSRKRGDLCYVCMEKTGSKGGWGLCLKHYKKKRYETIKDACISALGGACKKCGGCFHRSVYDFHHIGGKEENPSIYITNRSSEVIANELSKCILLCANCHRIVHHG